MVITISRETGSGGHTVGKMLTKTQTTEIILDAMKKYNGGKNNA